MRDQLSGPKTSDDAALDSAIRSAWKAASPTETDRIWQGIERKISQKPARPQTHSLPGRPPHTLRTKVTLGLASIALLAIGWFAGSGYLTDPSSDSVFIYSTNPGERATINLPDGSQVVMNVASTLSVPANFGKRNRSLELSGEAMFTVQHSDGIPFTVRSGSTLTKVLGTTFVVRRYPTDTSATVSVRDGKVAVDSVVVAANEMIHVMPAGIVREKGIAAHFAFVDGDMIIEPRPFRDAIADLGRWFNADIQIVDDATWLNDRIIQGTFSRGTPRDLASILSFMFDVDVEWQGQDLTIRSR